MNCNGYIGKNQRLTDKMMYKFCVVKSVRVLRKSPAWDENLQAVVINGTRTHNPDYNKIYDLAYEILRPTIRTSDEDKRSLIHTAIRFLPAPMTI